MVKGKDYNSVIRSELDKIEYDNHLISNLGDSVPKFHSGCLVNDLILGGGIPPAMVTYSGHETGGKTTLVNHTLKGAVDVGINPIIQYDAENARDPEYNKNIFLNTPFEQLYGIPKLKGGWEIPPLINYYPYSQLETAFRVLRSLLRVLPDKLYRKTE